MVTSSTGDDRDKAIILALQQQADPLVRLKGRDEWLSASEIAAQINDKVNRTTIFRSVAHLLDKGLIEATGETKSRRYRLAARSLPYLEWDLSRPKDQRPAVFYNPALLENYEPNVTRWLSIDRCERLMAVGRADFMVNETAYRRVMNSLLIDLSYASSRLENVQISWLDTKSLIELGERPEGLSDKELRIVMNHKDAIQFMTESREELVINRRFVFDVHSLLSAGLLGNPADSERIRRGAVGFEDSAYHPLANPFQLEEQFNIVCEKASAIENPLEQSVFVMTFMSYLQPFTDANKRTSRLSMNAPLLRMGMAPFSFTQVNRQDYLFGLLAFYERGRHEFIVEAFEDAYFKSAPRYVDTMRLVQQGGSLGSVSPISRREEP